MKVYFPFEIPSRSEVFPLLQTGFADIPVACCTVLPSFTPEYAWSVERRSGGVYLFTNIMAESHWQAAKKNVPIISRSLRLDSELTAAVEEVFREALVDMDEKDTFGIDGVTYYFGAVGTEGAFKVGAIWSPWKESPLGRLAQISDDLFSLTEDKGPSQTELATRCRRLLAHLCEMKARPAD